MTIIAMPKQDPEPHEADLVTMDALVDEALLHISQLRTLLLQTLNATDPPLDILEHAVKLAVLADMFTNQFNEPHEYFGDAG